MSKTNKSKLIESEILIIKQTEFNRTFKRGKHETAVQRSVRLESDRWQFLKKHNQTSWIGIGIDDNL